MSSFAHLAEPPSEDFWRKELFLNELDDVLRRLAWPLGLQQQVDHYYRTQEAAALVEQIVERCGGGDNARKNLVLVGVFTEFKQTAAIEDVTRAVLGEEMVKQYSTQHGNIKRNLLMALLYERDPRNLLAMYLWHLWHTRRQALYEIDGERVDVQCSLGEWYLAANKALVAVQNRKPSPILSEVNAIEVFPGSAEGDVLIALREWPDRTTGRLDDGSIVGVDEPDWVVLRIHDRGNRIEITDQKPNRSDHYANALLDVLAPGAGKFRLVLEALSPKVLDHFLQDLTNPSVTLLPLLELVAEVPWQPGRPLVTLSGSPQHTVEKAVADLRRLGAFALDWRTVRSAKIAFKIGKKTYRIQVHFPQMGHPMALTYSDVENNKRITAAFAALLRRHLHAEVTPKARRGTDIPTPIDRKAPRKRSLEWWGRLLQSQHRRPESWLEEALNELWKEGWLKFRVSKVFDCGNPYIDRRAVGVDSLDCSGVVEIPFISVDEDDPYAHEDNRQVRCSLNEHVWRPGRYGLPMDLLLRVKLEHAFIWTHIQEELAHYGDVQLEPGRPGVLSLRLETARVQLVYVPLVQDAADLDPDAFGRRTPVIWVVTPDEPPVPSLPEERMISLAKVLHHIKHLAKAWNTPMPPKKSRARPITEAPTASTSSGPAQRIIELCETEIRLDGVVIATQRHRSAFAVFEMLHLAAATNASAGQVRHPWSHEELRSLGTKEQPDSKVTLERWISRTRKAIDEATGTAGLGRQVIKTRGDGYHLGDAFSCVDRRLQAEPEK